MKKGLFNRHVPDCLKNHFDRNTQSLSARQGSVIIVDNVVRKGGIIDAESRDENIQGVRKFNELLSAEPRVKATAIQTVGSKGYDGFAIVLVIADED
ncbi:hypothetical protein [Alkalinema sp. FACHB-956]|uniref:hypothetical protein n=1 Tax=Alkalinema sp. FACHB-956 TaxID=2692768 RepID=UPI0016860648|nr:hypothetical protein [Alkalinema sp. FACHB-956]MBD2330008.1 hypothetical protein [Alkalinema sp. FACHB-956]